MQSQKTRIFSVVLVALGGGLLLVTDVTVGQIEPPVQVSRPMPMVDPEWFERSEFSHNQWGFRTSTPVLHSRVAEEPIQLVEERKRIQDPRVVPRPALKEQTPFPSLTKAQRLHACMNLPVCKDQLLAARSGRKPMRGRPSGRKEGQEAFVFEHMQSQAAMGVFSLSTRAQRLNMCNQKPQCAANLITARKRSDSGKPILGLVNSPYSLTLNHPYFFSTSPSGNARLLGGQGHNGTYVLQPGWPAGVDSSPGGKPFIRLQLTVPYTGWYLIDFYGTGAAAEIVVGPIREAWDFRNSRNQGNHYIAAFYLNAGDKTAQFWAKENKSLTVYSVTVESI